MIYSGKLNEYLEFYRVVETQGESGYHSTEEEFLFKARAERLKNKESYGVDGDEIFHLNELTFRLRDRKEVRETDIVVYRGDRYRITSINRYLEERQMTLIIQKINE